LLDLNAVEPKKLKLPAPDVQSRLMTKRASSLTQFRVILERSYKEKMRDLAPLGFRFLQILVITFLSVSIFWDMPRRDLAELVQYMGFIFYCCIMQLMIGVLGSVLTFIDERPLFLRE
jgi:hypothetical protein